LRVSETWVRWNRTEIVML